MHVAGKAGPRPSVIFSISPGVMTGFLRLNELGAHRRSRGRRRSACRRCPRGSTGPPCPAAPAESFCGTAYLSARSRPRASTLDRRARLSLAPARGRAAAVPASLGLVADVVNQIVYVQHVAAGEDARERTSAACSSTTAPPVTGSISTPAPRGKLVFGDQADRQKQRVAGHEVAPMPGRGRRVAGSTSLMVTPSTRSRPWMSRHRVVEQERNAVVLQALDDVALQAAGIGHELRHQLAPSRPPRSCGAP